jgi:hypothetical protein
MHTAHVLAAKTVAFFERAPLFYDVLSWVGIKLYPRTQTDEPEPRTDVAFVACSFCSVGADG